MCQPMEKDLSASFGEKVAVATTVFDEVIVDKTVTRKAEEMLCLRITLRTKGDDQPLQLNLIVWGHGETVVRLDIN